MRRWFESNPGQVFYLFIFCICGLSRFGFSVGKSSLVLSFGYPDAYGPCNSPTPQASPIRGRFFICSSFYKEHFSSQYVTYQPEKRSRKKSNHVFFYTDRMKIGKAPCGAGRYSGDTSDFKISGVPCDTRLELTDQMQKNIRNKKYLCLQCFGS